ncbi:agmatinase, putative (chromatophore) [Paulinella micropora]|uniref:Agmatinase, putative n=1 Tax=Paulinella micropora TaxID=1928728 RepID=A0A1L5YBT2_9EUKA|nr:putative agmatinase [Paulinella micropora]AQX44930.1 putative agmatinase [Paulinella micropora]BBL86144.1 agmatinase, putative [Paulinella micropora]
MTSLFDTDGTIYMGAQYDPRNASIGLFSVAYDGTTSFRPGARFGPSAIRDVSTGIETYDPQLDLDLENTKFTDFGSVCIPAGAPKPVIQEVYNAASTIIGQGLKPLMLGGEHSITSGALAAIVHRYPNVVLIQLDAHADLRKEWMGNSYSHACAMRRCLDILPTNQLLQIDIRSGSKEEFFELKNEKRLVSLSDSQSIIRSFRGKPIYLTIDLDWFDPSIMSGTGTPEPGGFFWKDFALLVDELRYHSLVGADIVELSPLLDPTGCSSILAAKVTRSVLLLLGQN